MSKAKRPRRGSKGSTSSPSQSSTSTSDKGKGNGGSAAGTEPGIREKTKTLQQRWDRIKQDIGRSDSDSWTKHPNGKDIVFTATYPNGTKKTNVTSIPAFGPGDTSVFRHPDKTIDVVKEDIYSPPGTRNRAFDVSEWLQIHPDDSQTYRNVDGTVIKKDRDGRTILPVQPAPPNDGKRKVIGWPMGSYTDGTTFTEPGGKKLPDAGKEPVNPTIPGRGNRGRKNGGKTPDGSLGGEKSLDAIVDPFGNSNASRNVDNDASSGNSGSDSGSGSSGSGSNSDSNSSGGYQDDQTDSGSGFTNDDENYTDNGQGGYDDDGGSDSNASADSGDDSDTDDPGSSGPGGGGSDDPGSDDPGTNNPGTDNGGGQPPPAGLDFPEDDSTPDPPKSDGFEPAPGESGDDEDDGSRDGSDDSGSDDGGSDDSGSDDGGSDDGGSDDGTVPDSGSAGGSDDGSDAPSDNSGVGFTPSEDDRRPIPTDPATKAALRRAVRDRVLGGGNGNNSTPTDDDSSGSGKGDEIYRSLEPAKKIRTKEDMVGNPGADRVAAPKASIEDRPMIGPNQNQIMPAPDADVPQQGSNSGAPIVNQTDTLGDDGSGQHQPGGSGGGSAASSGNQGQSGSSNGTSQSAGRPTTKAGSSAAVQRFLKLLGNQHQSLPASG